MCGIIGSFSKRFRFSERDIDVIAHRGPDGAGYFAEGDLMLGHRRLSILDLSTNGSQPMQSVDGRYTIVFNGEIYNHQEIRKELTQKGYTFHSTSDTETLLYGFADRGTRILESLNGIFAFALYDREKQELIIARDHFGIKPLYYYDDPNDFAFCSELKALLQVPGFDDQIDQVALTYYLKALYAPGELTPFLKVRKLLPGHFIRLNLRNGERKTETYYKLTYPVQSTLKESDAIEQLDQVMRKAVERQLMSDVPLGYFLSGGLDSSLIVAMAKQILPGQDLRCYTISTGADMQSEGFADDETYARKVAKHIGVDLEILPANLNILEHFDKMIWHLDEPQADPAPLNVYNICSGARNNGIKVLLGGTAGDDLFSGYRRHQALQLEPWYRLMPKPLRKAVALAGSQLGTGNPAFRRMKKLSAEAGKTKAERMAGYFMWMPESQMLQLFQPDIRNELVHSQLPAKYWKEQLEEVPHIKDDLNKMLYLEMTTFLPDHNLNYTDKMSMAVGVEARVPFLDTELVAFANQLPVSLKMKGNTTKYILKKVAERYLPQDVIYRPKTGFGAPVRTWIREDLAPMIQERLSPEHLKRQGIFDPQAVQGLIHQNQTGKLDASYSIWSLLAIESWIKQFKGS